MDILKLLFYSQLMSEFESIVTTLAKRPRGKLIALAGRSVTGKYLVHGDIGQADCLVVPAFGYVEDSEGNILPGDGNEYLARLAADRYPHLPKILQFQVDDAYKKLDNSQTCHRIEDHRVEGGYVDTREVAGQAVEIMHQNGWRTAALLAHPNHIPRLDSVMNRLGANTVVEAGVLPVWLTDSPHIQTTNPHLVRLHEMAALAVYAKNGWLAV